jgi:hypothetical protein
LLALSAPVSARVFIVIASIPCLLSVVLAHRPFPLIAHYGTNTPCSCIGDLVKQIG